MNFPFPERRDQEFLSQIGDSNLLQQEILRLKRSRDTYHYLCFAFVLLVIASFVYRLSADSNTFTFALFLFYLLEYRQLQNRIPLPLLAERMSAAEHSASS